MRSLLAFAFLFLSGVPLAAAGDGPVLARDGKSDYVITLPEKPTAVETTAAKELQSHLEQVTGAKLEIVAEDKAPEKGKRIVVGACKRLAQLLPDLKLDAIGYDGIVVKTVGDTLVLTGHPKRGALHAVYTFLEDTVGCRWWTPTESTIPKKPTLAIPKLDVVYAPKIRIRETYYRNAFPGVFAARCKCNGHSPAVPAEYGGHERFAMFVHTFFPLLPPAKYFAEHPEWYSEIDGKRKHEHAQLCLTNDEMRKELTHNALNVLRNDPTAGVISISQNDWHGRCQCAKCKAIEDEEGSPSGPLLRFVNAVAEDIEKEFPDVLVETLAYQYTRTPPKKTSPRRNVVVRLCTIECSFVQPLSGPQNEKLRNDIDGWSKIAPQLYVWDYVTNFSNYIQPQPNLRVLGPNLRFFRDHNVIAMFEQGDDSCNVGDFVRLRAWLLAHLLWDPSRDEKALIREFLEGYYGPAAPHLEDYLNVIHDAVERSGIYLGCYSNTTSAWLALDDVNAATRHFEKAEAAVAGEAVIARRLRRDRMPLDFVWLQRYHELRTAAKVVGKEFLGPKDPAAARDEFIQLAREWDIGNYREGQPFAAVEEPRMKTWFRAPGPPPAQCKDLSENDWIDIPECQFNLASFGKWTSFEEDAKASDGRAARMPGDHEQWAVSAPISRAHAQGDSWRVFVVARAEATAKEGPAMTLGIYDETGKRTVVARTINVADATGDYHVFDLGTHQLRGEMYAWVAPPKRPGEVTAVYVDRIFLIREKAKSPENP